MNNRGYQRSLAALAAVVLALTTALMTTPAAELTTAETSVVNDTAFTVSVEQGNSSNFSIYVGATGAIKCVATSSSPATASVRTSYSVSGVGALSSSSPSSALNLFGGPAIGGPNCTVTWTGAPTPYSVSAAVSADAATPVGFYPSGCGANGALGFSLPTAITNPSGAGGSLTDAAPGKLCVQVVVVPTPADTDPPIVDVSFPAPPAGQNGWFNASDVPVVGVITATDPSNVAGLSCTDDGSPLALDGVTGLGTLNASATTSLSSDGSHDIVCTATDGASPPNSGAAAGSSNTATIMIDTTPPEITASIVPSSPAASGWYNAATGAPTVSFSCFDATSGLAEPCPSPVSLGDGEDQSVTGSVSDNAGNTNSDTISDIDVDTTLPEITASINPSSPSASGWYNAATGAPTVSFSCSDATSGLAEPCPSPVTLGDGENQSVTGSVSDNAGNTNSDTISDIDVDTTLPEITASINPSSPSASGWYNTATGAPTVSFSCFDATSGLGEPCPSSVTLGDGENQSVTGSVSDNAGNTNSDTISDIDVDTTLPEIFVTGYSDGQVFYNGNPGAPPTPGCSVPTDATSGVAGSSGPTLAGGGLNANGVGFATYQCEATDNAGNTSTDSKLFFVYYGGASGILQPINSDNSSVFHRGKAVPVKFRLAGDEFFGYDTSGWLLQRIQVSCTTLADLLVPEEVGSVTPHSAFRYDAGADQYIYNADFRDKAVGTCWRVKVSLDDGFTAMYSAYFKIAK